jgi:ABC-type polysaccharide/polyol phosphate export permease
MRDSAHQARFPTWLLVLTSAANAVITLTIFSVFYFVFLAAAGHVVTPLHVVLYVFYLAVSLFIVTGIAYATSVLFSSTVT